MSGLGICVYLKGLKTLTCGAKDFDLDVDLDLDLDLLVAWLDTSLVNTLYIEHDDEDET